MICDVCVYVFASFVSELFVRLWISPGGHTFFVCVCYFLLFRSLFHKRFAVSSTILYAIIWIGTSKACFELFKFVCTPKKEVSIYFILFEAAYIEHEMHEIASVRHANIKLETFCKNICTNCTFVAFRAICRFSFCASKIVPSHVAPVDNSTLTLILSPCKTRFSKDTQTFYNRNTKWNWK